jgi:hypothetical protein
VSFASLKDDSFAKRPAALSLFVLADEDAQEHGVARKRHD